MDETKLLRHGLRAADAIVNGEPFEADLAEGIRKVVGVDCVTIDMWPDFRERRPTVTLAGEPNTVSETEIDRWLRAYAAHPYMVNLQSTGDPRPYRTSDFITFDRFRATPPYRDVLAGYGLRHELVMTPQRTSKDRMYISLARGLRDFSDRETQALLPLRDLIATALDYRVRVAAIQAKIHVEPLNAHLKRSTLTERENQVLALIATGCTNDQAARKLGISPRTIRKHLEGIFAKANVPSRAAAVAWWLRQTH